MKKINMLVLLLSFLVLAGCGSSPDDLNVELTDDEIAQQTRTTTDTIDIPQEKTFTVTGENFKFMMNDQENPDIVVNQGDRVRIEFLSTSGFHDWTVDEFDARTEQVREGSSTFVEFTADKEGTFEYYCSVGNHRSMGMKGNLIVN